MATPDLQPKTTEFSGDPIYWWNNGIWGEAGYAIPNCGGRSGSANSVILELVQFIGEQTFSFMHADDVKFSRPPNATWAFNVNKMINVGLKRLKDKTIGFTGKRDDDTHAQNAYQHFVVYPVPFFEVNRVRNKWARSWCQVLLKTLSEIMQHSDNDYDNDITDFLTSFVSGRLIKIRNNMATELLGYTIDEVQAPGFVIPETAFDKGVYDPARFFTSSELVEERNDNFWWPQESDLTPIRGVAYNVAQVWAEFWPHGPVASDKKQVAQEDKSIATSAVPSPTQGPK